MSETASIEKMYGGEDLSFLISGGYTVSELMSKFRNLTTVVPTTVLVKKDTIKSER